MAKCSTVIATVLMYSFFIFWCCYKLPFSQLYRKLHDYDLLFKEVESLAAVHVEESKTYFKNLHPHLSSSHYKEKLQKNNLKFVFGVITVKRHSKKSPAKKGPGYILQSMALLDKALKESKYLYDSVPFICNVDLKPNDHDEAANLYAYMPYTERYGNNSLNIPPLSAPSTNILFADWTKHSSKYNKETVDYSFCLLTAAYLKPKFVILIEDDTIPHKDFPIILEHLVESRLKNRPNYAYLKLYFPPKWQGFAAEFSRIFDLIVWACIMSYFISLCLLLCKTSFFRISHDIFVVDLSINCLFCNYKLKLPFGKRGFVTLYCICILTIWLLGRQNVEALRRIWRYFYRLEAADGCCTQAQMYPIEVVYALSEYLLTVPASTHTDLAISDFAAEKELLTWQVEPNLFFHNGLITSLSASQKHPEEFMFRL